LWSLQDLIGWQSPLLHACLLPKPAGKLHGIDAGGLPPGALVACAMRGPVMHAAERDREFIACLAAQRAWLHVAQMMGIGWLSATDEARLLHANPRLVPNSTSLWTSTELWNRLYVMNAQELRRLLASKGCTFETHKGGSGHVTVRRGDRKSQLPMHGGRKELGKGLVN
jgi:mRNA interferase HicA